jgi:hypothetical protein
LDRPGTGHRDSSAERGIDGRFGSIRGLAMKLLTSVSLLIKLIIVCFLIGFLCGFWFAGKAPPVVTSNAAGGPAPVSGWTAGGPA